MQIQCWSTARGGNKSCSVHNIQSKLGLSCITRRRSCKTLPKTLLNAVQAVVERLVKVVSASLETDKHIVEVRLPVDALEILPPEPQSGWIVSISLEDVSVS